MFEFDFGRGEDLDRVRETVRNFATDRIAPRAAAIDESWAEMSWTSPNSVSSTTISARPTANSAC